MTAEQGTPAAAGPQASGDGERGSDPVLQAIRAARDRRWSLVRRRRRWARAAVVVVPVLLGVVAALVWAAIAPGQQVLVYANGSYVTLPTADYHPFDGLALAIFSAAAVGLVVAVSAWRVRAIRGAATLAALALGTAAGGAVMMGLGLLLAGGTDPATVGATAAASVVVAGASFGTPLLLAVEPLVAVATYTFLAAWDGRGDLGAVRLTGRPRPSGENAAD